jgi:POT family proton-dependent oligopeptide transporter
MRNFARQPKGFSIFFMTEMWERYGFYIIQGLLVLYLTQYFHLSDKVSYSILGSFTALAYINPVLGGYIADKILGAQKSILWGALLISLGYLVLITSMTHPMNGFMALGIVAIGTGLLKPNVSTLLGTLYAEDDPRRHAGFTLFYVGINIGNALSFITGGYLQQYYGWHITFLAAAVVMLLAFAVFYFGSWHFKLKDSNQIVYGVKNYLLAVLFIALMVVFNALMIHSQKISELVFGLIAILSVLYILKEAFKSEKEIRYRLIAYLALVCISVFFWAIFFQMFLSMNLFIDRVVDRTVFGYTIPTTVFLAIESFGVIFLGPVLSFLWQYLERRHLSPSTPMKFALGLLILTVAFAVLFFSSLSVNAHGQVFAVWLVLVYIMLAFGELLLSPTGLAMVTELAPKHLSGVMMGVFFVSLGLGGKLAGVIANFAAIPDSFQSLAQMEGIYHHAFEIYMIISLVITLISFVVVRWIKNLVGTKGYF